MPAARHLSRSPFIACAVIATIGTCRPVRARDCRIAAVASRPSISGICTSIRTRSKAPRRRRPSTASRPLLRHATVWPCFSSIATASRWLTGLSSASSTRSRPAPSRRQRRPRSARARRTRLARARAPPGSHRAAPTGAPAWSGRRRRRARGSARHRARWPTEDSIMIVVAAELGARLRCARRPRSRPCSGIWRRAAPAERLAAAAARVAAPRAPPRRRRRRVGRMPQPVSSLVEDAAVRGVVVDDQHGQPAESDAASRGAPRGRRPRRRTAA